MPAPGIIAAAAALPVGQADTIIFMTHAAALTIRQAAVVRSMTATTPAAQTHARLSRQNHPNHKSRHITQTIPTADVAAAPQPIMTTVPISCKRSATS